MLRASKIVRGLKEGLTEQEPYQVADHVVRATQGTRRSIAPLDDEATSASPPDDLGWTRRENGDPVANCGHFGGTVLSEDLGWGADR